MEAQAETETETGPSRSVPPAASPCLPFLPPTAGKRSKQQSTRARAPVMRRASVFLECSAQVETAVVKGNHEGNADAVMDGCRAHVLRYE